MHARLLAVGACLAALALTHGPGRRAGVSGGVGAYWFAGCNTAEHDARHREGQAWYYQQPERGVSVALEGSVVHATETVTDPPMVAPGVPAPPTTFTRWGGLGVGRIGYQWPWAGVEGGLALGPIRVGDDQQTVLPSLRLRVGVPRHAYAFASLLAEETRGSSRVAGLGIGHAGQHVRAALGYGGSQGNAGAPFADLALRLGDVWAGFGGQWHDRRTYSAVVNLGVQLED